jgi:hypothetical protein
LKSTDVRDELANSFDIAPLPPPGPDGALDLPPMKPKDTPPPRLCEAGPCIHYHRFQIQLDAETAKGDRLEPGGQIAGEAPTGAFHAQVHHYCYPTAGVETILGELPVMTCNHWDPISPEHRARMARNAATYFESPDGKIYLRQLSDWNARQNEIKNAEDTAAQALADAEDERGGTP